jgi:hypothetical protein
LCPSGKDMDYKKKDRPKNIFVVYGITTVQGNTFTQSSCTTHVCTYMYMSLILTLIANVHVYNEINPSACSGTPRYNIYSQEDRCLAFLKF